MAINIASGARSHRLTAIGNDEFWYEDIEMASGTMIELAAANGDIDSTEPIALFGLYSKAFVVNGDKLRVADFANTKLTAPIVTDPVHQKGDIIKQDKTGGNEAYMIVDNVVLKEASTEIYGHAYYKGTLTAFDAVTAITVEFGDGQVFTPSAASTGPPHWYTWTAFPDTAHGEMPEQATLGCAYRGRAVLSGNPLYPYQWYMSRQADPWDWLYAKADAQSPVAGANADAGQSGDVVTCLAPYQDDYLILGCTSTIWVLRGDPASGGSLDQVSHITGIFGARSYCWDGYHNFYFWGDSGIYKIPANLGPPELLTAGRLPNIIGDEAINPQTHRITMAYDAIRIGVLVSITVAATGVNSNYFYNLTTDGFFRETYPVQCAVYSATFHNANDPQGRGLLIGCTDGYIRKFDETAKNDDIEVDPEAEEPQVAAIESHAFVGPGAIGGDPDSRGRMKTLSITTGTNTDTVDYDVHVKDTAEEVVDAFNNADDPLHTGTIAAPNRVQTLRPRSRGAWMGIVLKNENEDETWSFEKAVADVKPAGGL